MGHLPVRAGALVLLVGLAILAGCTRPEATVVEVPMPQEDELRQRIDRAIAFNRDERHMDIKDQAAWQVIHGALAYGRDLQVYHDGQLVSALDYLLGGGQMRGWELRKGDHGLEAIVDPGSKTGQGHEDQWLGYLSQCGLTLDDTIKLGGETFTIKDLLTQAQWDIYDGMEATWTLMAVTQYLPQDVSWTAKDGSKWDVERIVKMETAQDLSNSACGGTHRMYALAKAVNKYLDEGGELSDNPEGTWELADKKIADAVAAAKAYQQPDGSFSANHFSRAAASGEIDTRISVTGHVLEFLMVALDDEQLREPWVSRAVVQLVSSLEKTKKFPLECGGLYHSAHALELYRQRRWGDAPSSPEPAKPAENVAKQTAAAESAER